jgi:pimeloyl-ACP methyl ester carboxylesterase
MIEQFEQSDGYVSHYRVWGPGRGKDVIVMLHGGMSHSAWQAPLGEAIAATDPEMTFMAVDRRGSGANTERGHISDSGRVITDIAEFLRALSTDFERVHLAGWCFGSQVATAVAARLSGESLLSSLVLMAPGFFFNERYGDVLRLSIESAEAAVAEFSLQPEATRAYIKVPLEPADFTAVPEWRSFIEDDKLKLVKVTDGTVQAWEELAHLAEDGLPRLGELPVLAIFGRRDRLVDNPRVRKLIDTSIPHATVEEFDTGHAVQFEEAERLAQLLTSFVGKN